jgi:putative heme-binding domain-containing protein
MNRLLLLGLFLPTVVFAQANAKIVDPDPEIERKSFILPEGFEVSLYAADPLLAKPIQINFDPQGRLWVASSEIYPQIKPGQKANDKILILEDTDGDGKADKTTIFADGLLIPTGVEPGDGGAYVANSTELVHFKASKPGQKADISRVVLSGFGTEDTHHIIHTFRWGPESLLYFNQSIYIHSHLETPHGVKRLNAGGIWRCNPDSLAMDVFVRGFVNTWGHHFDRWGQSLITDGAYGEGVNHGVPGAYFVTAIGATRLMKGLNPGSPKHCGLEVVSGRHLPDDWQGDVITNDFRGHRVCRFKLGEDGSTFTSREMTEVIKTNHPAFRPIDVKMGPDGAIYIADWYNPIIQHGEVDFRDPRRDHVHGRIWRITAKGRPLVKKPALVGAKVADLLEQLKVHEDWTRQQAKRVLKERGPAEVLPALDEWVKKLDPNDTAYEHHLLEAMWVYQSLLLLDRPEALPAGAADVLSKLTTAKDYRARAAACRALTLMRIRIADAEVQLAKAAVDAHPRVRMEAVRGLAEFPTPFAVASSMKALDLPVDRTLDYALWLTARDLAPVWTAKLQAGEDVFGGNIKGLSFALQAVGSKTLTQPVLKLARDASTPADRRSTLWLLLAKVGGPEVLNPILKEALTQNNKEFRLELLQSLESNLRQPGFAVTPGLEIGLLTELAKEKGSSLSASALRVLGLLKQEAAREVLEARAQSEDAILAERKAALDGLLSLGGNKSAGLLDKLSSADQSPATRRLAIETLTAIDLNKAASKAAEVLEKADPKDDFTDLFNAFLARKGGAVALAKAIAGKKINSDVAKVGLRAVRASVQEAKALTDALTQAGNLAVTRTDYTAAEVKALVDEAFTKGNAARGELVFRRKESTCLACHAIAGAGGLVGPDMTSIGASAQPDYLVESLLMPNKAVKEGYHAMKVTLLSGKVLVGVKTREADGKLYLRTAEDKEIAIAENDIDEKGQSRSLMPDGLGDQMTRGEFVDLVRFLSELGKVGSPYAPSKVRLVRRWQTLDVSNDNLNLIRRGRAAVAAETPDQMAWSNAYATVGGEFPLADMPKMVVWNDSEPISILRGQLDVTTGGQVKLKINSAEGLTLYVGNQVVDAKEETLINLQPGVQNLTFIVNLNRRKQGLRVELEDVPGSPARANIVSGK